MSVSIEEALAQLDPKLRKKLGSGIGVNFEYQPTPSFGLNKALGGGLPYGRQVLIWGSKSSAKSSMCLQMIALAQAEGKLCAWIDSEMSYSEDWARKMGVDPEKLIYSQARTISDMVDVGVALMNAGVDLIVVDSITSMLPAIYFEKDTDEMKALENTKQIGAESRDFSNAWKMLNYANNKVKPTLLVLISQSRNNINAMYTSQQPSGGQATKFGRKIRWELQFSKTSPGFQSGEYDFYFRGDVLGVDAIADLVDTAESMGFVERTGAWYILPDGTKIQGREGFINRVREDLDLQDMIKNKISGQV